MQSQIKVKNSTILITSANYFTIAKFRYSFISRLISSGHKVILYSSNDTMSYDAINKLEKIGAKCIKTGGRRGSYSVIEAVKYILGYNKILRNYSVDIVINFTIMPMILGGIVCRFKKLKFVSVVTGLGSQYHGHFISKYLVKYAYSLTVNFSNQIWFVSESDARIGGSKLRLNTKKIRIIYGAGIPIKLSRSSFKEKNHVNRKINIIYMGRIRKDKGIEDFIALANRLSLNDKFSLTLMGGMDSSDKYIQAIVEEAEDNNRIKRIDFNFNNLQYLTSSDVLLLCSKHEGMPTVILEAMANFVVPISSHLEVIEELKRMGAKIFSYESGDINSLIAAIKEVEELKLDKKAEILKNNFDFVSKYFHQDEIARLQYDNLSELFVR